MNDPKDRREQQGSVYTGNYWPLLNNLRSGDEYIMLFLRNNAKCMWIRLKILNVQNYLNKTVDTCNIDDADSPILMINTQNPC